MEKSPGQIAYEADITRHPSYHDGTPRRTWENLSEVIQSSWEKNPTPRDYPTIDESDEIENEYIDA